MGQIFVDTPNEGRILVNIAGEEPTSEEEKMIKEKFFSESNTSVIEETVEAPVVEPIVNQTETTTKEVQSGPIVEELPSLETTEIPVAKEEVVAEMPTEAEGWQAESEKVVAENTDTDAVLNEAVVEPEITAENYNAKGFLEELSRGVSAEDLVTLMYESGTDILEVDGKPYDFAADVARKVPPQEIMDFLLTGKEIRDYGAITSTVAGANKGLTEFAGLPFELSNWLTRKAEQGVRFASNSILGTDLSLKDEDMTFSRAASEGGSIAGGDDIRAGLRKVGIDIPDSKREIPSEYRSLFTAGRVVGENFIPAAALYKMALTNALKIASQPNMHPFLAQAAKNPKAFAAEETIAVLGGAIGAGTASELAPDNPYWEMGGEVIGTLGMGFASAATKNVITKGPLGIVTRGVNKALMGQSDEMSRRAAAQEILISLEKTKQDLLEQAKRAEDTDPELATALRAEADGYTVDSVLKALDEANSKPTDGFASLPAGTATDNEGLLSIQNTLMGSGDSFDKAANKRINDALAGMWNISSRLLKGEGTRQMGENMRSRYIQTLLKKEMMDKSAAIQDAVNAIPKGNMEEASVAIQGILREGKKNLRAMETFWWNRIDKTTLVDVSEVGKAIKAQQAKMPSAASVADGEANQVLQDVLRRAEAGEAINTGEVLSTRSYFLDLAREAAAAGKYKAADRYDEIAGSFINTLNNIDGPDKDVIGMARAFSVKLNETYNRYWIKDTLASASGGGTLKDPRLTVDSAFSGSPRQANINLRDAQDASDYTDAARVGTEQQQMVDLGVEEGKKAASEVRPDLNTLNPEIADQSDPNMYQAIKNFRQMFFEPTQTAKRMRVVDTPKNADEFAGMDADGNIIYDPIKPTANNAEAPINDFPDEGLYSLGNEEPLSKGELTDPAVSLSLGTGMNTAQEIGLQNIIRELADSASRDGIPTTEALNRFLTDNSDLVERFPQVKERAVNLIQVQEEATKLVENIDKFRTTENFNNSVAEVFASNTPSEGFGNLVDTVKQVAVRQGENPELAMEQLRASTFDMMLTTSRKEDGSIDFMSLSDQLFKPMDNASEGATRMDVMIENGLMDEDTSQSVASFIFEAIRVEKSTVADTGVDQVIRDSEVMISNLARVAGANVGVLFGRGDASLQAASLGSEFMNKLVTKLPQKKMYEQMQFLFLNPKMMADYISKNPTIQKRATENLREGFIKVSDRYKNDGPIGATLGYIWDGTKYVAKGAASGIVNRVTKPPIATINALDGNNSEVSEGNLPSSIDNQMMDLNLQ